MVQREIFFGSAILTFKIVALEYILPRKINALVGGVNISVQADDRWHGVALSHGMKSVAICRPDQFAFIKENKNKGALDGANHQGTVVLIKHQYPAVHVTIVLF